MKILEESQVRNVKDIQDVPLDDLMKVYKVFCEMKEVCTPAHGIGLSAVQVGIPWKLFIVKSDGTCPLMKQPEYGCFINCEYETVDEDKMTSLEGCLSIKSKDGDSRFFQLERFSKVRIKGLQLTDDKKLEIATVDVVLENHWGIVFQHEIDHQRQVFISDLGKEVFLWQ